LGWGSLLGHGAIALMDNAAKKRNARQMRERIALEERNAADRNVALRGIQSTETFCSATTLALPAVSHETLLLTDGSTGSDRTHFEAITRTSTINLLASGGSEMVRNQAITFFCQDAIARGKTAIVLHCGNEDFQRRVASGLPSSKYIPVDGISFHYDPFAKMSPADIATIMSKAAPTDYRLPPSATKLIEVAAEILKRSGVTQILRGLVNCPVNDLFPILDKRHSEGRMDDTTYNKLTADYGGCQREAHFLGTYLHDLKGQLRELPLERGSSSLDYDEASRKSCIISINISNSMNDLLVDLITEHLRDLFRRNRNIAIVLDGLDIHYDNKLIQMLKRNRNCNFAISSPDAFAAIGAKKEELDSLLGADCRLILLRHGSPRSAEYWSEYFGKYERTEILSSFNESQARFMSPAEITQGYAPHKTEVAKILPDVFKNLTDSQFCAYDAEIGYTLLADITRI
jgi:hypothetical protein